MAAAMALDPSAVRFGPSFGVEGVVNDPFLYRHGARVGLNVALAPWVEVGTAFAAYPVLGAGALDDPDWKPLTEQLVSASSIVPDLGKLLWQWQTVARIRALRVPLGERWDAGFGMLAGVSVSSIQHFDSTCLGCFAVGPQNQVRVGPVVGVYWEVATERTGLRVRYEHTGHVETPSGASVQVRKDAFLAGEVVLWLQ